MTYRKITALLGFNSIKNWNQSFTKLDKENSHTSKENINAEGIYQRNQKLATTLRYNCYNNYNQEYF